MDVAVPILLTMTGIRVGDPGGGEIDGTKEIDYTEVTREGGGKRKNLRI